MDYKKLHLPEGIDAEAFERAMSLPPAISIKLNRRKCQDVSVLDYGDLTRVAWCDSGYYLEERPKFTLNPLLHAGVFYVQDASSMIYETIVSRLLQEGYLPERPRVLDLCAAPGGKTTSIINALPDGSPVIANEVVAKRFKVLKENLQKWGYPEVEATNRRTDEFAREGQRFDLVAVDAPCSGEGMMRKDEEAVSQWSEGLVRQCADLQREILGNAIETLVPGGILIYSTCTFNSTENEENAAWLVEECGMEPVDMTLPEEWGIGRQINSPYPALRFMPHITRGEGLFAAVFRKPADGHFKPAKPGGKKHDKKVLKKGGGVKGAKGNEQPGVLLPLSCGYRRGSYPECELDLDQALKYLRHEALVLPADVPKGLVTVTYKGHPLGFVKNIGNRANNLFPKEWRIKFL